MLDENASMYSLHTDVSLGLLAENAVVTDPAIHYCIQHTRHLTIHHIPHTHKLLLRYYSPHTYEVLSM